MFKMTNYNLVHQAKQCCEHGGLIIYVHDQFKCTQTELIIEQTSGWEYLCVEISNNRQPLTKHVLCNIYIENLVIYVMSSSYSLPNFLH